MNTYEKIESNIKSFFLMFLSHFYFLSLYQFYSIFLLPGFDASLLNSQHYKVLIKGK